MIQCSALLTLIYLMPLCWLVCVNWSGYEESVARNTFNFSLQRLLPPFVYRGNTGYTFKKGCTINSFYRNRFILVFSICSWLTFKIDDKSMLYEMILCKDLPEPTIIVIISRYQSIPKAQVSELVTGRKNGIWTSLVRSQCREQKMQNTLAKIQCQSPSALMTI